VLHLGLESRVFTILELALLPPDEGSVLRNLDGTAGCDNTCSYRMAELYTDQDSESLGTNWPRFARRYLRESRNVDPRGELYEKDKLFTWSLNT